jgi:GNAT superfamily N-acetyltransferase
MQPSEILTHFDQHERIGITYPDTIREEVPPNIVRHLDHTQKEGFVLYSKLTEENVEATIQQQIDYFRGLGYGFEWKVYNHDSPADLRQRLIAHGFEDSEEEALLILDIENAPPSLFQATDHDIRKVTDPADVELAMAIQTEVWEDDMSSLGLWLARLLTDSPDFISMYIAYVDDKPVCSAWIFFSSNGQYASIYGGSTLKEYRKQGIYSAILGLRVREAKARGCRYISIDASPMSKPITQKHGFVHLDNSYAIYWKP